MGIAVAIPRQSRVGNKMYVFWRYMFCTTRLSRRDWELLMPTPFRHRRPPLGQAGKTPPSCSRSAAVGGAYRRAQPSVMPVLTEPTPTVPGVIPLPPRSIRRQGPAANGLAHPVAEAAPVGPIRSIEHDIAAQFVAGVIEYRSR